MDKSKLKIVFIHQDGDITGSAISLSNMITGLISNGHSIIIIVPKNGNAIRVWKDAGAEVYIIPFTSFWTSPGPRCLSRGFINQLKALVPNNKLKKFILSLHPDLIHINDKAALNAGLSLKNCKIPIIQHSRSAFHLTACKLNSLISAYVIKSYANHIICISEDEMQGFENIANKSVLFNTVDLHSAKQAQLSRDETRLKLGIKPTDIVIGMAESFNINKGIKELIEISKQCISAQNKGFIKFLLVGTISESDKIDDNETSSLNYLNNFIRANNYRSNFILTGFKSDVLNYIAAMDILIVAKAHGVVGRQPIEAQACKTVVIGINGHSKKSSIVKNGVGGYLLNSLDEVIKKLKFLIDHPHEIGTLSENGYKYASENFNTENYIKNLEHIYYSTIK